MEQFVHLHLHTEFSLLDGATRTDKLFARCAQLGQPAVAITDHGNMYGAMTFFEAAKNFNYKSDFKVKPIIGCEVYTAPDMTVKESAPGVKARPNHLILLCKNLTGYKNLIKLVSLGFTKGFYYKPRIDFDLLSSHCEGLICLSACIAGELPQAILEAAETGEATFKKANEVIRRFKKLFGDDYYIEIQDHKLRSQREVLPHLVRLAAQNGVKIVATNDVHYLRREDARMQKVLQCISFGDKLGSNESVNASNLADDGAVDDDSYFPTQEFYLKSYDEMAETFPSLTEALTNTLEVADKCGDCSSFFSRHHLTPEFNAPDGMTPAEYLRKLTYDGISERYKKITPEVKNRAEYELSVIESMGFVDYFLIVCDFIRYAESIGVPVGPGRGSGAGSIVAYATGITKLDPLAYDLYFERFLNPERVSNPDFDIDFCPDRRAEVIKYVQDKYGDNNVSQIATFGTLAAKAAIKDVGRVLDVPFAEMNKITKLLPKLMGSKTIRNMLGIDPINAKDINSAQKEAKDNPNAFIPDPEYARVEDLIEMYNNDPVMRDVLDLAMQIEGMPRQTGLHAAGVIICKDPISDHTPMSMNAQGLTCTQYNMTQCEALGLLKMDFLGLTNLTDIKTACDYIEKKTGVRPDLYNMDYNDPDVYKMLSSGDCAAVFQIEGGGLTKFMKELKPDCLEDLIAGISLYRPGPMQYIPTFIHNKKHPKDIVYKHKVLERNLAATYGVMVYQEQVMNICRELAGYSLGGADSIRRFMSKKKKDKLQAEKNTFIHGGSFKNDRGEVVEVKGAVANGMKVEDAETLFAEMEHFAEYAFNKSHAAAYAYITYQTAYLKCHHLKEFMSAVLNNRITNIKEITKYLTYLKERKVPVYPPDVNRSEVEFSVEGEGLRIGLAAIKGVGAAVMQEIVDERKRGGAYTDLMQLIKRIENSGNVRVGGGAVINKKVLENLIFSGACDCFGIYRSVLIQSYELILDRVNSDKKAKVRGQYSMFDMQADLGITEVFEYPNADEYSLRDKLRYEKEVTGVYLSGHPLQDFSEKLAEFKYNSLDLARLGDEPDPAENENDNGNAFEPLTDNMQIRLGGMIISAEKRFSKNGKEFGGGLLEDLFGTVELLISQSKWPALKNKFITDKVVTVTGRLSVQSDRAPSVWVDSITEWSEAGVDKKGRRICCYLAGGENNESYAELIDIAKAYPGCDQLYVKDIDTNALFLSPVRLNIDEAHPELSAAIGAKNVRVG